MADNNRVKDVANDFFSVPTPQATQEIQIPNVKINTGSKVEKLKKPKVEKLEDILIGTELQEIFEMGVADLEKKTIHLRPDQIEELEDYLHKFKKQHRSMKPKEIHFMIYLIDFALKKLKEEGELK